MGTEMEIYILRLGGSLITPREEHEPTINRHAVLLAVQEIVQARRKRDFRLVITHGMGSYGHPIASEYGINEPQMHPRKVLGAALLARSLRELNAQIVDLLIEHGIPALSYSPTSAITDHGKIVEKPVGAIARSLEMGFVPVVQAFPVADVSQGIAILSSDHISPYLAKKLGATLSIIALGIDGIYDVDPKQHRDATLLRKLTPGNYTRLVKEIGDAKYADVTGGMRRTLGEAIDAAREGVSTRIVNGTRIGVLSETLLAQAEHGTLVTRE